MKLLKLFFIVFVTFSLTSCVESLHPLSEEKAAKYDESILGIWKDTTKGKIFIHIGKSIKTNLMTAIQIEHRVNGEIDYISVDMFPSMINKTRYMNVKSNFLDQKSSGYYFLKYELISKNSLRVCTPEYALFQTAVHKSKLLQGASSDRLIKIEDGTSKLIDFFREASVEKLFQECNVFKRMNAAG